MLQKGLPGAAEDPRKFRPGVRCTHIDDSDRFEPRLWWLDAKEARGLSTLHATPELSLGGDNEVLVEWIGMGGDLDPFASSGNH